MNSTLHDYFDKFYFSIFRTDNIFTVQVGEHLCPDDVDLANLNGQEVNFGSEDYLWPSTLFLAFHNSKFRFAQEEMRAGAEPHNLERHDSEVTIRNNLGVMDWLKNQNLQQSENPGINV